MGETISGSCLCGDVAWEIDGPCDLMAHCHCSMCRKSHGTAFATFVTFPRERFRWTKGGDGVRRYESSPRSFRSFCGRCGSKVPSTEPFAYSPAGPLVGDVGIRPTAHMFVASKAPWHDITDDAAQFDAFPPLPGAGMPESFETRRHTEPAPNKLRGSCLCGAAAFEVDGPLVTGAIVCCHCSRCRAARGTAHGTNLFIEAEMFRWLRGQEGIGRYAVPDTRFAQNFCTTCGSVTPAADTPPGRKLIPAGALDDDPGVRAGFHIMTGSKAAWHVITGKVPQHAEYPPPDGFPPIGRTRQFVK